MAKPAKLKISIIGKAISPKTPAVKGVRTAERIIQRIQNAIHATLKKMDWKAWNRTKEFDL